VATVSYRPEWLNSGRLKRVLDKINDGTSVNLDGAIQFIDWDFQQYFDLLSDAFRFPESLTGEEFRALAYRGCLDLRKEGVVTKGKLLEIVNKKASDALAVPVTRFSMWTNLRLRRMVSVPGFRVSYGDVNIRGVARLPEKYVLDDYFISGVGDIRPNAVRDSGYVILQCKSRSEEDAAKKMFNSLDTFYAITNLFWRSVSMWTDRHIQANVWMGPYQFFWKGRQFLGKDKIWYSPNFDKEEWRRFPKDAGELLKRLPQIRHGLRKLETHPLRPILSAAAKLVHEGMASPDLSYRLLRYWSALETLYSEGGNKNVPYERLIRRATFAEKDRELAIMKLEHLARLRNIYVHSGDTEREKSELTQYLREVLAHQILYLIRFADDLQDHNELLEMVDLPSDLELLERRRRAIKRRENIIRHGRHLDQ